MTTITGDIEAAVDLVGDRTEEAVDLVGDRMEEDLMILTATVAVILTGIKMDQLNF